MKISLFAACCTQNSQSGMQKASCMGMDPPAQPPARVTAGTLVVDGEVCVKMVGVAAELLATMKLHLIRCAFDLTRALN